MAKGLPVGADLVVRELLKLVGCEKDYEDLGEEDRLFFLRKINRLLRDELECFRDDDDFGEAAYILYGLTPGTRGAIWRIRAEKAAQLLERQPRTIWRTRKTIARRLALQILLRDGGADTSQLSPQSA